MNKNEKLIVGRFRYLLLITSVLTYLTIVFGGISRVAADSLICPTWISCYSSWFPIVETGSLIQYLHLMTSSLTGPMILLSVIIAFIRYRTIKLINLPLQIAVVLLGVQTFLGAFLAKSESLPDLTAFHFGLALWVLALITISTVVIFVLKFDSDQQVRLSFKSPFAKISLWSLGLIFLVLISGAIVTNSGHGSTCLTWPLCDGLTIPTNSIGWVNMIHRIAVGLGAIVMILMLVNAWKTQRTQRAILTAATSTTVLYFSQAFVGAIKTIRNSGAELVGLHEATAAAVLASAVLLCVFVGLASRTKEEEIEESEIPIYNKQRIKDLLSLTKPIVVLLLLFTTYAGMVIGAREIPSIGITFWTMLGGALAAGGSGAVNQYIDRFVDQKMTRTAKRPIASGRMTSAEGLAFGVSLLFIAFFLMAGFVNLLAALLSLAGMIYYVLLYSIFLKTTTIQNIVIGGGAGAIPPLVGWAASTGGLDAGAWYLFLIIFMWTPPHFWALALVRTKDYANAGIPMLPVVKGELVTRQQIFIYTILLAITTIMMYVLDLAGVVYLVLAILLGIWLILTAWKVLKKGGNKIAWKMYRYSSMYLAFLFLALMVDALI